MCRLKNSPKGFDPLGRHLLAIGQRRKVHSVCVEALCPQTRLIPSRSRRLSANSPAWNLSCCYRSSTYPVARNFVKICIVGLGYVGLPLAIQFGRSGAEVIGLDVRRGKVDQVNRGRSYIKHIAAKTISEVLKAKRLTASTDFSRIIEADAVIICVPTPLSKNREPDISFIIETGRKIAPHLQNGALVVLESTTYPGTTDEDLRRTIEENSKLKAGVDFHLAFSPEREDPGNPHSVVATIPKVVGGLTPACLEKAVRLYSIAIKELVPVSSCRVAEAAKLLENIFRSVNIALVNELKQVYAAMGIDIWEVINAAKTKPFGFMAFYPGPGLGGHCIPIDPFYLTWKAREFEFNTRFIELAGEINWQMPYHVVDRTIEALNEQGKSAKGAKVLILGLAYKKNIDDLRESPSIRLIELFRQKGFTVEYHDPYCPRMKEMRHQPRYMLEMQSVPLEQGVEWADVVVIATDHDSIDYQKLVRDAKLVVDSRNATRNVTFGRDKIKSA